MSDQLHKPLTGQYGFTVDADRQATLSNLGFGATAAAAAATVTRVALPTFIPTLTVASGAATIDWSIGRALLFAINSATTPAITFTFSNPAEKQFDVFIAVTGTPTITWPSGIKWPGSAAPAVPATGKFGWYRFYYNAALTAYFGEGLITLG